jgi:hypothetical protein
MQIGSANHQSDKCLLASRHDAKLAIDISSCSGQPSRKRRGQIGCRETYVIDVDQFTNGRAIESFSPKDVEMFEPRGGSGPAARTTRRW